MITMTMKRTFAMIAALTVAMATMAHERPVQFNQLPSKAQNLITKYFADLTILYATYDREVGDNKYEVVFSDGTQIEFNRRGEWRKIDRDRGASVPSSLIPKAIIAYVEAHFPAMAVEEIDFDSREYEVKLSGDVELTFDRKGKLKWYD